MTRLPFPPIGAQRFWEEKRDCLVCSLQPAASVLSTSFCSLLGTHSHTAVFQVPSKQLSPRYPTGFDWLVGLLWFGLTQI